MVLQRFLRNNDLSPLLAKARELLDPGWGVGVVLEGRIVASLGLTEESGELSGARSFISSFSTTGHASGQVVVVDTRRSQGDVPSRSAQQVADFLAQSLEMLLRQEEARRSLAADSLQKYRELSLIHRATVSLNASLRLREVGRALLAECQSGALPMEMGMFFLREGDSGQLVPAASFGAVAENRLERIAAGPLFADIMDAGRAEIVSDLEADPRWHSEVPGLTALVAAPITAADARVGALVLATTRDVPLEASHLQYVTTLVSMTGTALGNAVHFENIQTLLKALLQALATAIDSRDPFTAGHSHRVASYAVALAKVVGKDSEHFPGVTVDASDLAEIYYAGLLHDVGKIGVREQVLTKATRLPDQHLELIGLRMALLAEVSGQPWKEDFEHLKRLNRSDGVTGQDAALVAELASQEITAYGKSVPVLTEEESQALLVPRGNLLPEERREIERHPSESFRILQHIPFPAHLRGLPAIISQHHERLDGSGYPLGLAGEEIPLMARVLMTVDIYDAITNERHYKHALPQEKALLVLEHEAEQGKLDENLVRLMAAHIDEIEADSRRMGKHLDFDSIFFQDGDE